MPASTYPLLAPPLCCTALTRCVWSDRFFKLRARLPTAANPRRAGVARERLRCEGPRGHVRSRRGVLGSPEIQQHESFLCAALGSSHLLPCAPPHPASTQHMHVRLRIRSVTGLVSVAFANRQRTLLPRAALLPCVPLLPAFTQHTRVCESAQPPVWFQNPRRGCSKLRTLNLRVLISSHPRTSSRRRFSGGTNPAGAL